MYCKDFHKTVKESFEKAKWLISDTEVIDSYIELFRKMDDDMTVILGFFENTDLAVPVRNKTLEGFAKRMERYVTGVDDEFYECLILRGCCRPAFTKRYFFPRKNLEKKTNPYRFSTISDEAVMATVGHYDRNNLFIWLAETFGNRLTLETARLYRLGTSKYWNGACVFWQTDIYNRTRIGKIMLYDRWTGHRIKEPGARITWVHSLKMFKDFWLQQCFFGEHLLNLKPHAIVGIVESEKTAMICSMFRNDMVWLATGGLNNLNTERCRVLKGRKVTLFTDLGAEEIWEKKAAEIPELAHARINLWLRERAGQEDIERGLDLGDWVVRYYEGST